MVIDDPLSHCVGNMFEAIDVFMTEARTGRIEPKKSLITRDLNPIDSGSLLEAIDVTITFRCLLISRVQ